MARIKCKMCKIKRKIWETDNFFGVKCNKHFVPMIILKEHKTKLTNVEKVELSNIIKDKYQNLFIDSTISCSDDHWHIHLSKKNKNCLI